MPLKSLTWYRTASHADEQKIQWDEQDKQRILPFSNEGSLLFVISHCVPNALQLGSFIPGPICSKVGLNKPGLLQDLNSDLKAKKAFQF